MFDAYDFENVDPKLRNQFLEILNQLEKNIKINAATLGMETLTNAVYYFCKF